MSREKIQINNETYVAKPVSFPLVLSGDSVGSIVANENAPLLFGNLSISYDYSIKAPRVLVAKLFSDDGIDKEQCIIRLHSDNVTTIEKKDLFFDSLTIDDNFINDHVSIYFDGYELKKPVTGMKNLVDAPLVNNAIYVAPVGGGGGTDWANLEQQTRLLALVYDGLDRSLSNNINNFEKGKATNVTFNWNIEADDDILTSVLFGAVDKSANLVGNQVFNGVVATITKILAITVQSGNNPANVSSTAYARVPQFSGKLADGTNEPTYTQVGLTAFDKVISSSATTSKTFVLVNEYAFFISNNANSAFTDIDTNFGLSLGEWNSTTAFFIKKTVVITLADGTTENVTLYRTRETKSQTLNVKIN